MKVESYPSSARMGGVYTTFFLKKARQTLSQKVSHVGRSSFL